MVLDTDFVRTGLEHRLRRGRRPACLHAVEAGKARIFMEAATLRETLERLPRFAGQLGVSATSLRDIFEEDWLPSIMVVKIPESISGLDPRALEVQGRDPNDYQAAALAALLSPCIVLTQNFRHFQPLGVQGPDQGKLAMLALLALEAGDLTFQGTVALPAVTAAAALAGAKRLVDRLGPGAYIVLGAVLAGGLYLYRNQRSERRQQIKQVLLALGRAYVQQYAAAQSCISEAQGDLWERVIPGPPSKSLVASVVRTLAISPAPMSAEELQHCLGSSPPASVGALRAFLGEFTGSLFRQESSGRFSLGLIYRRSGLTAT